MNLADPSPILPPRRPGTPDNPVEPHLAAVEVTP
jgi:hypothetical protein